MKKKHNMTLSHRDAESYLVASVSMEYIVSPLMQNIDMGKHVALIMMVFS